MLPSSLSVAMGVCLVSILRNSSDLLRIIDTALRGPNFNGTTLRFTRMIRNIRVYRSSIMRLLCNVTGLRLIDPRIGSGAMTVRLFTLGHRFFNRGQLGGGFRYISYIFGLASCSGRSQRLPPSQSPVHSSHHEYEHSRPTQTMHGTNYNAGTRS